MATTTTEATTATTIQKNAAGGAIVTAAVIEGAGDRRSIPSLVLCQGTAEEVEMYGDGKRGKFLDSLDGTVIGESVKVVICGGFMTWSKWVKGQKSPAYTYTRREDVPPADLLWREDGGARVPPAATECVNAVVCVEGVDWPFLFRFKRTGLKCYEKKIEPLETRRRLNGKGAGCYTLAHTPDKNPDGKPYLRLTAAIAGDGSIPESMAPLARKVIEQWEQFRARAQAAAESDADGGGDAEHIPF
jgi:hypothetical protein